MRCPFCGCIESRVIDSRGAEEGNSIRRRRECLECIRRFTTYEMVEQSPLIVVKKDGRRVIFEQNKLLTGIIRACEKRDIPISKIEEVGEMVERDIRNTMEREITTGQIGEMVMRRLKELDQVAYVRFVSVYRQFTDVNNFMDELKLLMKNKE
ncbi:transcriptional regulator NrdR [Pelosinus sp. IPA-1]|uniref:transcriptional regulator NrdR n=1 Tax=Pelosinus sp. IPA-1 TaxID=3029569 RepID=UPI002436185D|nr:transcriptional regulator NrdR [Pelosinus sp. IPA-1]GMA99678.1 transcriptional repressor NrdR [Pelosinus sp. IPA-1]